MPTINGQSGEYDFTADGITLSVTATGTLSGVYGIVMGSYDRDRIENYGTISGTRAGILLGGTRGIIDNHGVISGDHVFGLYGGIVAGTITNSGTISGYDGVFLYQRSDGTTFTNTGLVRGTEIESSDGGHTAFRLLGSTGFTIVNSGMFDGDLDALSGGVAIHNSGTINGRVFMGTPDGSNAVANVFDGTGGHITGGIYGYSEDDMFDLSGQTVGGIISGGLGADIIIGTAANDTIYGDSDYGDPATGGGPGNGDTVSGGLGDDVIHGGLGDDIVRGNQGNDTITGDDGNDTLYGNQDNDRITGGNGNDHLDGGQGDDILAGGDGDDVLEGGAGNDSLDGGNGSNTATYLHAGSADTGGVTIDLRLAGSAQDTHAAGLDTLTNIASVTGGDFNDTLIGDDNANTIQGGNGDDAIVGAGGDDRLFGNNGNDVIQGGEGNDYVHGGQGADRLFGNVGSDELHGGSGDDYLNGGQGDDILFGEVGANILVGGVGADTFVLSPLGHDLIADFNEAAGDRIDLGAIDHRLAFVAGGVFTGSAGELIVVATDPTHYRVEADFDGDRRADYTLDVTSPSGVALDADGFIGLAGSGTTAHAGTHDILPFS